MPSILLLLLGYLTTFPEKYSGFTPVRSKQITLIHSHISEDYENLAVQLIMQCLVLGILQFRHSPINFKYFTHQLSYSKSNFFKRSLLCFSWNELFFQTVYSRPASWDGNSAQVIFRNCPHMYCNNHGWCK